MRFQHCPILALGVLPLIAACSRGPTRQDYIDKQVAWFDSTYDHTAYDSVPTVRDTLKAFRTRLAAGEFAPPDSLFRTGQGREYDESAQAVWPLNNLDKSETALVSEIQAFHHRIDERYPSAKLHADSVVAARAEREASSEAIDGHRAAYRERKAYESCLAEQSAHNTAAGMSRRGAQSGAEAACASKAP